MNIKLNGNDFYRVTTQYGETDSWHKTGHTGIDLAMEMHTKIYSPTDGVIENVVDYGGNNIGKGVIIKTEDGEHLILGHLSDNSHVHPGQKVHLGDYIADSGSSGRSSGPHLHVGLQDNAGHFISPEKYFNGESHIAQTPAPDEHIVSAGELLYNAISEYANSLANLEMNLISSINWDGLFDTLNFICDIFIL